MSRRTLDRVPAPVVLVGSGTAMYVGAAVAVGLFATVGSPEVAWLRTAIAAVVLVAWRRPWRERWTAARWRAAVAFGLALAVMNVAFYVAIDHLPLGTAVAIEFTGPVAVAALTGRGWRERGAIVVAAVGVVLLAGVALAPGPGHDRHDVVVGLVAITVAAAAWAAYILLGRRVAAAGSGVTTLAVAMSVGAVALAPALAAPAAVVLTDASLAWRAVVVALLSSVVPYVLEQVVLRRVGAATFSVLMALLPATAAVVGALGLRQVPSAGELAGLACVTGALLMTGQLRRRTPPPGTPPLV
ncbi:MAG TPA: EamA family transporter [Luteimicrobium sp.]|nr:EamA family transporter [Luteimicrobium sp.]